MFASVLCAFALAIAPGQNRQPYDVPADSAGQLEIMRNGADAGFCPLESTDVRADISGFGVRVTVDQTFKNPSPAPIEAVYTFPLSDTGAVDRMRMEVGDKVIEGIIKPRDEARLIYEAAKNSGQTASLLDQERPNIFTQSVANIMPGSQVKIEISYVELAKYESGEYEFSFPMTVGPRYLGNTPDPGKVFPTYTPEGTHNGAAVHLSVMLDAGAPIQELRSVLHKVAIDHISPSQVQVTLAKEDEVANRDFVLRYRTATNSVQTSFLTQMDPQGRGGFFTLIVAPPVDLVPTEIAPREILLVIDTSGSQQGFPLAKEKELALKLIGTLRPGDTFNVYNFNTSVDSLWPSAENRTSENEAQAKRFIAGLQAGGGTDIHAGILAALDPPADSKRVRLVYFETDGFVGNESEVLDAIQKHRQKSARVFAFGIGNSVNRYLIDAMGQEGKGDSEIVTLAESGDQAVDRLVARTETPVLTDLTARFSGVEVSDVMPSAIPDVFDKKPIVLYGRFSDPGTGTVTLTGYLGEVLWSKTISLNFTENQDATALPSLWARKRIDDLTAEDYLAHPQMAYGQYAPDEPDSLQSQIVDTSLKYGVMTDYTSFVAVEPTVVNIDGHPRTVHVPVEMADGVSYETTVRSYGPTIGGGTLGVNLSMLPGSPSGGAGFGGRFASRTGYGQPSAASSQSLNRFNTSRSTAVKTNDVAGQVPQAWQEDLFAQKVEKKLRSAKGHVEIQVWLSAVDAQTEATLRTAGLKIALFDGKTKIALGSCEAAVLKALVKLDFVQRIEPLGD